MSKIGMYSEKLGKLINVKVQDTASMSNSLMGWSKKGWSKSGGWFEV